MVKARNTRRIPRVRPSLTVNIALKRFRQAAKDHGKATDTYNTRKNHRAHDRVIATIHALRAAEPNGECHLARLLKDPDPHVREWAATYLLPIDEATALKALEELARGKG